MKIDKRLRWMMLSGFVLVCLLLVFLFFKNQGIVDVKEKSSHESYTIGLVLSNLKNPFFNSMAIEAKNEADRQGVNLIILDSNDSADVEYKHLSKLVDDKVDCIIVNPTDSDVIYRAIRYANDKAIPVLTVDRASNGGIVVCHIESDNQAGGDMIAAYLLEVTQNKGSYAETRGIEGTSAAQTRSKGFNDRMAKDSNMSRAAVVTADFDREKGRLAMAEILGVPPQLTALFAHNDEMALGAAQAAAKIDSTVLIFGFDGSEKT